jgi:hypothetical protein
MTNQNVTQNLDYEDQKRRISPVVYDISISQVPFLEILAYNNPTTEQPLDKIAPVDDMVVGEKFFHIFKRQDRGNVRDLAKVLLRNGMRTYVSGEAVKHLLVGKPQDYRALWMLGVPWTDHPQIDKFRSDFVGHLEDFIKKGILYGMDDKGMKRFQVNEGRRKDEKNNANRTFRLIPVPEGIVQKALFGLWRPSEIFLTLSSRESFKKLR